MESTNIKEILTDISSNPESVLKHRSELLNTSTILNLIQQSTQTTTTAEEEKGLGNEAFNAKDYSRALRHYTQAIHKDPNNPIFYMNKASCYMQIGQFEDAEYSMLEAIAAGEKANSPNELMARVFGKLGRVELGRNNRGAAKAAFQKSLELKNDPSIEKILSGLKD